MDYLFSMGRECYSAAAIAEGHIELLKYILTSKEVETYTQPRRKSYSSFKRYMGNLYRESMKIHWDEASITHSNHKFLATCIFNAKSTCLIYGEYTKAGTRINIGYHFFPPQWSFEFQQDNGSSSC